MSPRPRKTKTVEVAVHDRNDVVRAMADAGVSVTEAELAVLSAKIEAGAEPAAAFEQILDERVGPASRQMREPTYPSVASVLDLPDSDEEAEEDFDPIGSTDEEDSDG